MFSIIHAFVFCLRKNPFKCACDNYINDKLTHLMYFINVLITHVAEKVFESKNFVHI